MAGRGVSSKGWHGVEWVILGGFAPQGMGKNVCVEVEAIIYAKLLS